jgi:hypothetical protein
MLLLKQQGCRLCPELDAQGPDWIRNCPGREKDEKSACYIMFGNEIFQFVAPEVLPMHAAAWYLFSIL